MRILSWNVNGLRAAVRKGFIGWLRRSRAEVVAVQELRARRPQLPPEIERLRVWRWEVAAAERKGYSGVALFSRRRWDDYETSLGRPRFDREGRVQMASFGRLLVVNAYFPNGNGVNRDLSRIPYKLAFYRRLFRVLEPQRSAGRPILVVGDFNTAHREVDLARPRANRENSGFRAEERRELDRHLGSRWTDTFRMFERGGGHYTWWSTRRGVRERNIGWRIDYALASPGAVPFVRDAFIQSRVRGSDHCPIGVDLDPAVCG
jgi:exodeoxyribonuclease-3